MKHIHLFAYCLLSSIFLDATAIQNACKRTPDDNILLQGANRTIDELSALTQDEHAAETRSSRGSHNCGQNDCCGCTPKNDCCTKLQCRRVITTLDVVESKVCLLTECEPIPLSPRDVVGVNLTIDTPGLYCLCCDITANISIEASSVTLDMNYHQVTGSITITSNNISVSNGVVDATNQTNGINVTETNNNIFLSKLTVSHAISAGINSTCSTNLFISDVFVENSINSSGVNLSGGNGVFIANSVFFNNKIDGIALTTNPSNHVIVTNCQAISNGEVGFGMGVGDNRSIYFYSCTASQNGIGFRGHDGGDSSRWNAFDCVAEDNGGDGFRPEKSDIYFEGCLSKNNSGNGFRSIGSASGTINQCTALNNTLTGFLDDAGTTSIVKYTSNYATGNSSNNYDPATGPPCNPFLATDAGISYWHNTLNT